MILKRLIKFVLPLLAMLPMASFSQFTANEKSLLIDGMESLATNRPGTMVYIQPSKDVYETGEDLWFKAYVLDAQSLVPTSMDTTLYIQLMPVGGTKPLIQEKYVILNGFASGRMSVPDTLREGDYEIQAFSAHSFLAGKGDFKSLRRITLKKNIVPEIRIENEFSKKDYLDNQQVSLSLKTTSASGTAMSLTAITAIWEGGGKALEKLQLQTDYMGNATANFTEGKPVAGARIKVEASSEKEHKSASISIPVPYQTKKIYFYTFPEGGYLVAGLDNTLAFKAVDLNGVPLKMGGILLEDGKPLMAFRSVHDGMGEMQFRPATNKRYSIRLDAPYSDSTYLVPSPLAMGITLHYKGRHADGLVFKLYRSPGTEPQIVYLRAQVRGSVYSMAKGLLRDSLEIALPEKEFPQGMAEVTLFGGDMKPLAERLVYVNLERKLHITTKLLKPVVGLREKQSVKLKVVDGEGKPVTAHLGVSVFDSLYKNNQNSKNILAHYYLDNDLKGSVYDPTYYFDERNTDRTEALDLLLLTQGWRRYVWNGENLKTSPGAVVAGNGINGYITLGKRKKKEPQQFFALFFAPDNKNYKSFIMPDPEGRFALAPTDLASANNGYIYIKVTAPEESKVDIHISNPFVAINKTMEKKIICYPAPNAVTKVVSVPKMSMTVRSIMLCEVTIKGRATKLFRDKYMGYLDSITKANLVTDYIEVRPQDSANYKTSNIIFTINNPYTKLEWRRKPIEGKTYSILYYKGSPIGGGQTAFSRDGGLIFDDWKQIVYQYPQFTEEELLKRNNMARISGYNIPREFFSPDYGKGTAKADPSPDYRNTLYWKPDLITDENGEATVDFYSSDIVSGFIGRIEGVNGGGLLGMADFRFAVDKGQK